MAAYVKLSNGNYIGITTDTKPVNNTVQAGTVLYEFNAGFTLFTIYVNDGTNWLPQTEFAQTIKNKTLDSTNTVSSATSLPTVTVAKGGTGATTATLGFDALSPMTTAGDVIIGGASGTRTRLGIGTANQLLRTNSGATAPEWASTLTGLTLDGASNTIKVPVVFTARVAGMGAAQHQYIMPNQGAGNTTEGINNPIIDFNFDIKTLKVVPVGNTFNANTIIAFRDDGVDIGAITLGAGVTTKTTSTPNVTIATGSAMNFHFDSSASASGTGTFNAIAQGYLYA